MGATEIVLLVIGIIAFVLSFIIPAKREKLSKESLKEAKEEISFAMVLNPGRIKVIKKAVEEVMTEKFSKDGDSE